MTRLFSLAFAIGVAAAAPLAAFAQTTVNPHHSHHPARQDAVQQPNPAQTPQSAGSLFKPYLHPGDGDDDGISRDPDDCMKGCIGGNPG
jgi:hypothetical protein